MLRHTLLGRPTWPETLNRGRVAQLVDFIAHLSKLIFTRFAVRNKFLIWMILFYHSSNKKIPQLVRRNWSTPLRMCHAALLSRIIVVISVLVLSFSHTKGQTLVAPGGVQGAALWSRQGDSSDFFANYHTLNLLKLRTQADSNIPPMLGGTTLFLVLKPNFTAATGAQFLELGDILLYDNRLIHGSSL